MIMIIITVSFITIMMHGKSVGEFLQPAPAAALHSRLVVASHNIQPLETTPSTFTTLPIEGFDSIGDQLQWYSAPDANAAGGSWSVVAARNASASSILMVTPPPQKDYWRKTYYEPLLIKDNGPFLYATLDAATGEYYTIETTLVLTAVHQFDQGGIMIRKGPDHWIKAGIEVVDQQPRLSCVVTNGYSDWSTQSWFNYTTTTSTTKSDGREDDGPEVVVMVTATCHLRVHYRGEDIVVEAKLAEGEWQFVRIAHLGEQTDDNSSSSSGSSDSTLQDAAPVSGMVWAGVFAAAPLDLGQHVLFSDFSIRKGSLFQHSAATSNDDAV